jgi:hypothetical protein
VRDEDLGDRLAARTVETRVTHDADDLIRVRPALIVEDQVASNRILGSPRISRKPLIDDHDARRVTVVTLRKLASTH